MLVFRLTVLLSGLVRELKGVNIDFCADVNASKRKKMYNVLRRIRQDLGPLFVAWEAIMHVYILFYLTFHWTNWLVWGYTAFELSMFVYLLTQKIHKKRG